MTVSQKLRQFGRALKDLLRCVSDPIQTGSIDEMAQVETAAEVATNIRDNIVAFEMQVLTSAIVFGSLVPCMMALTPVVVWHLILAQKEFEANAANHTIGMTVATEILVHNSPHLICATKIIGLWIMTTFTMYDLEFAIAPQIAFALLSLVTLLLSQLGTVSQPQQRRWWHQWGPEDSFQETPLPQPTLFMDHVGEHAVGGQTAATQTSVLANDECQLELDRVFGLKPHE